MKKYMWYRLAAIVVFIFPIVVIFLKSPSFLIGRSIFVSIFTGGWFIRQSIRAKNEYLENEYLRKKNYGNTTIDN